MIQDFQLQPSISIWHDGENFKAQIYWSDADNMEPELSATTETHLALLIAHAIQKYVEREIIYNSFVN
ncbi:MAG: hypothetical protein KME21_31930 [Desmonostoc vinosum HA7617-LM4]|jgi:hypothetical protein|nr:hypothetical protein [Desmonostoc vinosum HA7617-LM4]